MYDGVAEIEFQDVKVEKKGEVAVLRLDRPNAMNALSGRMLNELKNAVGRLMDDDGLRAVILTGSGGNFCTGADLKEMKRWDREEAEQKSELAGRVFSRLESSDKVVVAAIEGFCLGGGQELALACDFRIAEKDAVFGQPEVRLGLIPGYGGTARLPRLVGLSHARSMILSGKKISAGEAEDIGLVDGLVDGSELLSRTMEFVRDIVERTGPLAYARAKELLRRTHNLTMSEAVGKERDVFGEVFDSSDRREGVQAFLEKRDPEFEGE